MRARNLNYVRRNIGTSDEITLMSKIFTGQCLTFRKLLFRTLYLYGGLTIFIMLHTRLE